MELPVLFQAEQFAQALLLGGLLGLVYDLLRAPRRFLPKLGTMLDALFLLLLFLSLLGFAAVQFCMASCSRYGSAQKNFQFF